MSIHISLDFWNTIGIPNPEYAKARNTILAMWYSKNGTPVSIERAAELYASVKATVDKTHSMDCAPLSMRMVYSLLDDVMAINGHFNTYETPGVLRTMLEEAFRKHSPTILPETVTELERISKFASLSIGSNTNFIRGRVIEEILPSNFAFKVFSDQAGWAKPHPEFWKLVEKSVPAYTDVIFHIGDNRYCDGTTPERIVPIVINGANQLPKTLASFEGK